MKEIVLPWWLRKRDDKPLPTPTKADYTVVSSVNMKFISLLRKHMVPKIISSREEIGLCNPREHGDIVFGIFLYDIQENHGMRVNGMQVYNESQQQFPPLYLDLYYMLTAYSAVDIRYREEDNHRMLVKAMQILHDFSQLDGELPMHIELLPLSLDQKTGIWNHYSQGYQLSLFYKISPIMLDSTIRREVSRVREIHIDGRNR